MRHHPLAPLLIAALFSTPAAAAEWQLGAALGGGYVDQSDGAPPICCAERDTWGGAFGAADLRGGVALGWFAAFAELGLVGLHAPETDTGAYTTGFTTGRLALEARIGDDDPWRLRTGLAVGFSPEKRVGFEAGLRLGAEWRVGDHWLGGEARATLASIGTLAMTGLMFTAWY